MPKLIDVAPKKFVEWMAEHDEKIDFVKGLDEFDPRQAHEEKVDLKNKKHHFDFLIAALKDSMSSNYDIRKPAEDAIHYCRNQPNYCPVLLDISCDKKYEHDFRLAAAI